MKLRKYHLLIAAFLCWLIAIGLSFPIFGHSADVSFSWLPNLETDLAGYKIHYGSAPELYTASVDCGLPATVDGRVPFTITNLPDGQLFYACTAYDVEGQESGFSDELAFNPIPEAPREFRGVIVTVVFGSQ